MYLYINVIKYTCTYRYMYISKIQIIEIPGSHAETFLKKRMVCPPSGGCLRCTMSPKSWQNRIASSSQQGRTHDSRRILLKNIGCWKKNHPIFFPNSETWYFWVFLRSEKTKRSFIDRGMLPLKSSTKLLVQFRCKEAWRVCKQLQPEKPLFLRQTSNTGQNWTLSWSQCSKFHISTSGPN